MHASALLWCAQASLNEFSGFKSESALRLGRTQDNTLSARVAAQATTVRLFRHLDGLLGHRAGVL